MRRIVPLLVLLLAAGTTWAQDSGSPHHMTLPNGEVDMDKCSMCHEEDMSLSRSKLETCTLCHSETLHGGSLTHLRATAAQLAAILPEKQPGGVTLPLTDDGRIFCGTCHLFHDPAVTGEKPLPAPWVPPAEGVPGAVREAMAKRWSQMAEKHGESEAGAEFAAKSTRMLRLPVSDGSLCVHCHQGKR